MFKYVGARSAPIATPGAVLGLVLVGAIILLPTWAATWFGIDPRVALPVVSLTVLLPWVILLVVPMRVSAESRTVFPGTPEQLFQIATDIKLSLQVVPNQRRRLLSVTGQPGQPGSNYVTAGFGGVRTTTVVSSDPPRKIVTTTTTSPFPIWRVDTERTYTPVAEGTLSEVRARERIPLLSWLIRPLFKRAAKGQAAAANARVTDYLGSVAANEGGSGN
jgi:Polyketide cyclase / dehydrase and lipid transport.